VLQCVTLHARLYLPLTSFDLGEIICRVFSVLCLGLEALVGWLSYQRLLKGNTTLQQQESSVAVVEVTWQSLESGDERAVMTSKSAFSLPITAVNYRLVAILYSRVLLLAGASLGFRQTRGIRPWPEAP